MLLLATTRNDATSTRNDYSSSSTSESELPEETRCYNDDPAIPVYQWGLTKGMATDHVAVTLIKENIERSKIATKVPSNVSKNTAFVVDTTKLRHEEDIKCDDMGAWECTGSKKLHYVMGETGGVCRNKTKEESQKQYELKWQSFVNTSDTSVRKIVITVHNVISDMAKDLRFIQYVFEAGEREIVVKPHGNIKEKDVKNTAYKRTMKSTKTSS